MQQIVQHFIHLRSFHFILRRQGEPVPQGRFNDAFNIIRGDEIPLV